MSDSEEELPAVIRISRGALKRKAPSVAPAAVEAVEASVGPDGSCSSSYVPPAVTTPGPRPNIMNRWLNRTPNHEPVDENRLSWLQVGNGYYHHVVVDDHKSYYYDRCIGKGTNQLSNVWLCDDRKACTGRLECDIVNEWDFDGNMSNWRLVKPHSQCCKLTIKGTKRKFIRKQIHQQIEETGASASEAYRAVRDNLLVTDSAAADALESYEKVKTDLHRKVQAHRPQAMTMLNFDSIEIPDVFCLTKEADASRRVNIVLARETEVATDSNGRLVKRGFIALGHPNLFQAMLRTEYAAIAADGTFKVVPAPFAQLLNLAFFQVMQSQRRLFVGCHVLMTDRTTETYNMVFRWVGEEVAAAKQTYKVGIWNLRPTVYVMCDFEPALRRSVQDTLVTFLPNAQLKGCYFHWCQCLWKHVQDGLAGLYRSCRFFKKFCDCLKVLAFVPTAAVLPTFTSLCLHYNAGFQLNADCIQVLPLIEKFQQYVSDTWLSSNERIESFSQLQLLELRTNNALLVNPSMLHLHAS